MLTVISAAIGLLGSFLPGLLNYLTANANNEYQLELIKLQMEAAKQNVELEINLAQTKADIQLQQSLYSYDAGDAGPIVNALRGSVRPVITYTVFGIWLIIILIGLYYGIAQGLSATELVNLVWDDNMKAIFITIIAFWFGSRMLEKSAIYPPINQPKTKVSTPEGRIMRMANFTPPTTIEDKKDGRKEETGS